MTEPLSDHAGVRFPPPLMLLLLFGAGLAADRLLALPYLPLPPWPQLLLGAGLILGALAMFLAARGRFVRAGTALPPWRPASALVTEGIYARSRNPIYLAMLMLLAGLAVLFASSGALVAAAVGGLLIDRMVIRREEAYLQRRFGAAYDDYRRKVRRWL